MHTLNRRTLLRTASASAAIFALSPKGLLRAQPTAEDRSFESELTGSVIELIDEQWSFNPELYELTEDDDVVKEYISVSNQSSTIEIEFVQSPLSPEEYLEEVQANYARVYDAFEVVDSGASGDGAWFAGSSTYEDFSLSIFCEYQAGAYENADLVVIVNSRPDDFQSNVPAVQDGILIGDLEPLIMVETSEVMSLEFPVLAVAVATETSGRSSRTTRGTSENENRGNTRSNRRGQDERNSTADDSYVDEVRAHRADFIASFSEFVEALAVFGDDSSTDAQLNTAFATIDRVAETWLTYSDRASELTAPAEFATLEDLYLTWADEIAQLGANWVAFVTGAGEVGAIFDQIDVVDQADKALVAELDSI